MLNPLDCEMQSAPRAWRSKEWAGKATISRLCLCL
jgi:hypothetical protein